MVKARDGANGVGSRTVPLELDLEPSSLITEGENTITSQMGEVKIKGKEIRMLSDDGKTLTVISTFTSRRGEVTRKLVYDKQ